MSDYSGRSAAYLSYMENAIARPGQTLCGHVEGVARLAQEFSSKLGGAGKLGGTGKLGVAGLFRACALLHDIGKTQAQFQRDLLDETKQHASVPHSEFGARQVYDDFSIQQPYGGKSEHVYIAEMFANVVAAHHGRLYDYLTPDGETPLHAKLFSTQAFLKPQPCSNADDMKTLYNDVFNAAPKGHYPQFFIAMLTKFFYSCLVDADRLDARLSESGETYVNEAPDWNAMLKKLEAHLIELSKKPGNSEIQALRQQISEACAKSGALDSGIYKLGVFTGGGKTLASMRFALEHARKHGMERIIYVIPYLSILSQTAADIREALGADEAVVLEHHSGFLVDPDAVSSYKLHTDRWDAPIILTTQVQFLESIFSSKGSDLRKLHNMAKSVIIFDEAQSVPVKCIHLFTGAISFLNRILGSTILLCTATQPLLDTVERPVIFSQKESIAVCKNNIKRYEIKFMLKPSGYTYEALADFVMEKHVNSTLIIVNTKGAAKALTHELSNKGVTAIHLSTNMCSAHRDDVLKALRARLNAAEERRRAGLSPIPAGEASIICVSTQLIEAGVDISFECVIRDLAGLDSIHQAAGRCNRHGEFGGVKSVYVINIRNENLSKLPEIELGARISARLANEKSLDIDKYYHYFFNTEGVKDSMNFPLPNISSSIYDLISANEKGRHAYTTLMNSKNKPKLKPPKLTSAIRSASEAFYVIDKGRTDVIVPYGESEKLADEYLSLRDGDDKEKRELLKKLGKYGVSLYRYQVEKLEDKRALYYDGGIVRLAPGFYDKVSGVDVNGSIQPLVI